MGYIPMSCDRLLAIYLGHTVSGACTGRSSPNCLMYECVTTLVSLTSNARE